MRHLLAFSFEVKAAKGAEDKDVRPETRHRSWGDGMGSTPDPWQNILS